MAGPGMLRPNGPGLRLCELSEYAQRGVRGSGETGLAKTEEAAAGTERIPLPPWLSLAPQPGPTRPGKGDRWQGSFSGARAGEGLGLPGPVSGPQTEGQGWSWRAGELQEKCAVNWGDPGSVSCSFVSFLGIFLPSYLCSSVYTFSP